MRDDPITTPLRLSGQLSLSNRKLSVAARDAKVASVRTRLLRWGDKNRRRFWWRRLRDPYRVAVVEVLLRQTSAPRARLQIRAFLARYPTAQALAKARTSELTVQLRSFGLHRQRARQLHAFATEVVRRGGVVGRETGELLELPGIGVYAAAAIRCFVYGYPDALVDVNVVRIIERLYGLRRDRGEMRRDRRVPELAGAIVTRRHARELNWTFLDFGAAVCTSTAPRCKTCPLLTVCVYGSRHATRRSM